MPETGGPAIKLMGDMVNGKGRLHSELGLTIRDVFAVAALIGFRASEKPDSKVSPTAAAEVAYADANAMLARSRLT